MAEPYMPPRPAVPPPGAPGPTVNIRTSSTAPKSGGGLGIGAFVVAVFAVVGVLAYFLLGGGNMDAPAPAAPSVVIENNAAPAADPAPAVVPDVVPATPEPAPVAPVAPAPVAPAPAPTTTP